MGSKIDLLVKLQYLDQNINSLESTKTKIPEELESAKSEMIRVENKLKDVEKKYSEYQKTLKIKEGEIEDEKEKVKKSRVRQNEVKTNDEYRALLKEIDFINSRIDTIEEELIKMFDLAEPYKQEIASTKKELENEKKLYDEQITLKNKELQDIESEIKFSREEREKLMTEIDSDIYRIYERLCKYKENIAISKIGKKGICQHCSVLIPPQTVNEVIADDKVLYCPNCQRILYYTDDV